MTILERLLERAEMKDIRLHRSEGDIAPYPRMFAAVTYHNSRLHSFMSTQSQIMFTFNIPWDLLTEENLTEEKMIDLNNGHDSLSLTECSEKFQNEVLKKMIAEKKPNETLYVEKYASDDGWDIKTLIPRVSCLEELEIMLDLNESGDMLDEA